MRIFAILFLFFCIACVARADQSYPPAGWKDIPSPLASPYAVAGGEITIYAGPSPNSLNYYLASNPISLPVSGFLYDTLLTTDPVTLEHEPGLAKMWSISDDKKVFTLHLDPRAHWSDGSPITAWDVKWTFDAIMDPKNLTGTSKVSFERFESPEVIDSQTIRFHAREAHWSNLLALGDLMILPKKAFENKDFNKINFEFPVVSGPYRIGEINEGIYLTLDTTG